MTTLQKVARKQEDTHEKLQVSTVDTAGAGTREAFPSYFRPPNLNVLFKTPRWVQVLGDQREGGLIMSQ